MGTTFKTALVACAAIAVSWLGAGVVQSGLTSQFNSQVKAYFDAQNKSDAEVLANRKALVDSLTGEVPSGTVTVKQ
jgi:hypothetical protein